jgi:flagellar FliJ protein
MTKKIERMQTVIELAQNALDQAAQTLQAIQSQLEHTRHQILSLQNYLSEIHQSSTSHKQPTSQSVTQLQSSVAFVQKVQAALQQEKIKEQQLMESVELARQQWYEKRVRLKGLEKVGDGLQKKRQQQILKEEQKQQDDMVNARHAVSKGSSRDN